MNEDERIAEIRARVDAATGGPWFKRAGNPYAAHVTASDGRALVDVVTRFGWYSDSEADATATFIAHARQDVPYLLDLLARVVPAPQLAVWLVERRINGEAHWLHFDKARIDRWSRDPLEADRFTNEWCAGIVAGAFDDARATEHVFVEAAVPAPVALSQEDTKA